MKISVSRIFSPKNSLLFCALIALFILSYFNGTGKEADSIEHYLYAKFAFQHPHLFLNHWAKPLFTLIASPFAQFGFIGMKVLNSLCGLGAAYYSIKIAKNIGLDYSGLAALFYFIFPLSFLTIYSGLTEPLFAFLLCLCIFLCLQKKFLLAAFLISFSPFIRSEGLIILFVFALFFLMNGSRKAILVLLTGHLIMGIVGAFYYGELWWVFSKIPYASLDSPYGEGKIFHFINQLNGSIGVPLYILFWLGVLKIGVDTIKNRAIKHPTFSLILLSFLAFLIAHSIFWYFGIFNSMGLRRVFAAVTPLMAIIALVGFNALTSIFLNPIKKGFQILIITIILIFPFTSNPAAVEWEKLNLSLAQETAKKCIELIPEEEKRNARFIYTDSYLGELLKIDPFDYSQRLILSPEAFELMEKGNILIWDNWHSVVDYGVELEQLQQHPRLKKIGNVRNEKSHYAVFKVIR